MCMNFWFIELHQKTYYKISWDYSFKKLKSLGDSITDTAVIPSDMMAKAISQGPIGPCLLKVSFSF
jgi:hypothetical protein